jgi:predicted Zn-dependent protease with MMP-like domain
MIRPEQRELFDQLLEQVLDDLPDDLHALTEEVPVIVEDYPSPALADELDLDAPDGLCGLHDGVALTERSVEASAELPTMIYLFRAGIIAMSRDDRGRLDHQQLRHQIRLTLLHEIGHHFGFDEDDLRELGYE